MTPLGILAERLAELARQVGDRLEAQPDLRDELAALAELAGGLDPYVERHTSPESPALAALATRTREHDWAQSDPAGLGLEQEMLSGHVEGQLLKMLVAATGARRVLEVGMFTGYSALAMAEALPADGELVACEIDAEVARFARDCFDASPAGRCITVRVGPALDTLAELVAEGAQFDLVFLDADKAGYVDYLEVVLARGLLASDGLLCVDNTLMQGLPWTGGSTPNARSVARFNDALTADPRVEQVVVPLRDGLTLARWARPEVPA